MHLALLSLPLGLLGAASSGGSGSPPPPPPPRPKLVVVITVDQLRPDYLARWKSQLTGGFATLALDGAVFDSAYQDHGVTETAPGHSTILSGRWPAHTGIVINLEGVQDSTAPLLGARGPGASPRRFRGTALLDWLKTTDPNARALSVSRKDRGAILTVGQAKEQVYWYADGLFTTSRYYADSLPVWVQAFNALRLPFKAAGWKWTLLLPDSAYSEVDDQAWENTGRSVTFPHTLPLDSANAAAALQGAPLMDSLTLAFALSGVEALKLGRSRSTDLLAVSLSTTDAVGHAFGPDSREIHDQVLRLDRYLDWFLGRLIDRYGRQNLLVVLTADHGVTPFTAYARAHGHPDAHAVALDTLVSAANAELDRAVGTGTPRAWLLFDTGILFLRDNGRLSAVGANVDSIGRALAARVRRVGGVARADDPADLARADTADDAVARRWRHQLPADAGALLVVTLQPFSVWMPDSIAEHGQPSELDSHVPLILWGRGIRPGRYWRRANTVDIAPTLARLLGISPLSLLDGRVLTEALAPGN